MPYAMPMQRRYKLAAAARVARQPMDAIKPKPCTCMSPNKATLHSIGWQMIMGEARCDARAQGVALGGGILPPHVDQASRPVLSPHHGELRVVLEIHLPREHR